MKRVPGPEMQNGRRRLPLLLQPLTEATYRRFAFGNALSQIGIWSQRIGVAWLMWSLTHSGTWLGLLALTDLLPLVLVTPFSGALADRWDRLRIMRVNQLVMLVISLLLLLLHWGGVLGPVVLLALMLANGIMTAFDNPFRLALLPQLLTRERMTAGVAFNIVIINLARFVGPALAGVILKAGQLQAVFVLNILAFAIYSGCLARLGHLPARARVEDPAPLLGQVIEGIRYVGRHIAMRAMLLQLLASALLIRPLMDLMPRYAAELHLGASGFATLSSVIGLGAMLGVYFASRLADVRRLAKGALVAVLVQGLLVAGGAWLQALWAATAAMLIYGGVMVYSSVVNQTVVQVASEDRFRGRVLALHTVLVRGAPALGALVLGVLSDWFGIRWPLCVAGCLTVGFGVMFWPSRRRVDVALRQAPAVLKTS